ncbi:tetratricopeptide repeat protein [Kutzneria chonburiensis]|uniref:Tetratricopeptide repeat protein n=1 Tax=Kutzneria chonburiensis TaxID=1483604 RepID=A0ABV6MMP3_9PSEU|nr:tetratricopeptide repeat protein [Kutzneria chonburiensis]
MSDGVGDSVVRRFRQRAGLTQEALAERSGVSTRTIRGLETGDRPNPQLGSLRQLADAMSLSPEDRDELMASVLGVPSVPRQLPAVPAGFTGREAELAQLDVASSTVVISAIAGAGGIGKTWLAARWGHRRIDRFPDGQLFVDLRGFSPDSDPLDPLTALRGFLDALGVDTARVTGDVHEHAARYRSEVANKRLLIVLDNAATADQVVPLLPGTPTCKVLVTSRRTLSTLLHRHNAQHLPLAALDEAEAHEFLVNALGADRVAAEPAAAAELIEACGRYPLALAVMVGRARHRNSLELAAELREHGLDALTNVLSWSLRALTDEQRTVFALLGSAPGADIGLPAAVSLTGRSKPQLTGILRALTEASLLTRLANGRYAMHDLIRGFAARQEVPNRAAALRRVLDFYLHTANAAAQQIDPQPLDLAPTSVEPQPIPDVPTALSWFDAELPNLLAAQRVAAGVEVWQLARTVNSFLYRRGRHHDRLAVWQTALAADLPDAARASAHGLLGRAYGALGRFEDATEHFEQALAGGDALQQANTHRMLAAAWEQRGDDRVALEHTGQALALYRTLDQPVWEADAVNSMGWYAARLGDFDDARRHCEQALAMQRRNGYRDGEAAALDSLGLIAHRTGRHAASVDYYEQSLAIFRDVGNTMYAAVALDGIGHPFAAIGRLDDARAAWGEALLLFQEQGRDADADRVRRQLDALDHTTAG